MSFARARRATRTVGFRLTVWSSSFFVIGSLALFGLAYVVVSSSLRQRDDEIILHESAELEAQYGLGGVPMLAQQLEHQERLGTSEPFLVRIVARDGTVLFLGTPERWRAFELDHLSSAGPPEDGWISLQARRGDKIVDVKSTRMPDGALLQVGKTTEDRAAIMQRFRAAAAGITVAVLVIGFGGGLLLTVWALRPLRQIIDTVRAIDAGALSARVPRRQTGDALDELGGLFNGMLDRIATLITGMRGALDTVAHDLRTPIARLRSVAELALRSDQRLETLQQALADCIEESDQLLTMLNTLMDISEAETGTLKLALEPVNVASIVEAAVDLYRHVAEDKRIVVSTAADPALWLMADRSRMRQVLANLIDNAIKYTPMSGRVDVEAVLAQNMAVISVRDTGIGVMAHEVPRIWDRLYRGAHSRSERGLGLGLSLVRAIVMAHGGRIDVSNAPGGGAIFTIQLPVSSSASVPEETVPIAAD
jgi:signal transduction histidine kinase